MVLCDFFETWIIESFYKNSLFLIMLQINLCLSVYIQVYVLPKSRIGCQFSWRLSYKQLQHDWNGCLEQNSGFSQWAVSACS